MVKPAKMPFRGCIFKLSAMRYLKLHRKAEHISITIDTSKFAHNKKYSIFSLFSQTTTTGLEPPKNAMT